MNTEQKCVMVIDESLPLGIIANTTAIMGLTLGKLMPETIGVDVCDKSGCMHRGVIEFPVPILKATKDIIKEIRETLYEDKFQEVTTVDFFDVAQGCKTYDEYIKKIAKVEEGELTYYGVALCGPKKLVNKLTGSMPLLR